MITPGIALMFHDAELNQRELEPLDFAQNLCLQMIRQGTPWLPKPPHPSLESRRRRCCSFAGSPRSCGSRGCSAISTIGDRSQLTQDWRQPLGRAGARTVSRAATANRSFFILNLTGSIRPFGLSHQTGGSHPRDDGPTRPVSTLWGEIDQQFLGPIDRVLAAGFA